MYIFPISCPYSKKKYAKVDEKLDLKAYPA